MSRYYDPEVGRFINEDGYLSTGQCADGHNMFAYCGNNPVNRLDPTGNFWEEIFGFISAVGDAMGQMAPAYAGCGTAALVDGPFPIGDIIGAVGCGVITIGVACKVAATDKNKSKEKSK